MLHFRAFFRFSLAIKIAVGKFHILINAKNRPCKPETNNVGTGTASVLSRGLLGNS